MRAMVRLIPILLLITLLSSGCAPSRPMPVLVEVADAGTGTPLPGVVVRADGGTFYIPTMEASMLGAPGAAFGPPPTPEGAAGETDEQGRAFMTVAGQRPVFLHFFKTGYPEGHIVIETGETHVTGAVAWTTGTTVPGIDSALLLDDEPDTDHPRPTPKMMFRVAATGVPSP